MRVVIPPGQSVSKVEASLAMSEAEATELRDALNAVLKMGISSWHVDAAWGENQTDVTVKLQLMLPGRPLRV
jgi:hypothetical protein